ncbi:AT-hook motif nuclear-localized protein 9-like [Capsicum annuum]|uniref:AT-hook motif nuclear-localized protein 9-like n=1 Tax=Capsicum annuum TaxID=4072 RepID=UPI001FB1794E|nr:AT-hook motif nuclear-localized protein 9-like [Capsicum annuum]
MSLNPTQKRGRGRPPGSGRKQQLVSFGGWLSNTAGIGFAPHVIMIAVGEDITTKIMSFSQQGPRSICILSANGVVSTVTLRQPSTSGGTVTYEGRFEILCLSGSFLVDDSGGSRGRIGSLSVSLASPDGRVIGGGVGGVLIAASPIQILYLGSFVLEQAFHCYSCASWEVKFTAKYILGF